MKCMKKRKISTKPAWHNTSHAQRRVIMENLIIKSVAKNKPRIPSHSYTHQLNTAKVARWYLKKIGASQKVQNLGELGSLGHDIIRMGPGHGLDSARKIGNLLKKKVGKRTRGRVTGAMVRHGIPAIKNGKRLNSDPVHDAVFFADRLEATGSYGAFRICVSNGALPVFVQEYRKRILKITNSKEYRTASKEKKARMLSDVRVNSKIEMVSRDVREDSLRYDRRPGFYKDGKPVDTISAEKYFPKEVLPTLKRYDLELEEFINALERRKPWALEIMNTMFSEGRKGKKELDRIIIDFKPKTRKAQLFRRRAIDYLNGKI